MWRSAVPIAMPWKRPYYYHVHCTSFLLSFLPRRKTSVWKQTWTSTWRRTIVWRMGWKLRNCWHSSWRLRWTRSKRNEQSWRAPVARVLWQSSRSWRLSKLVREGGRGARSYLIFSSSEDGVFGTWESVFVVIYWPSAWQFSFFLSRNTKLKNRHLKLLKSKEEGEWL